MLQFALAADWAWTYEHYVRDVPGSFEFWMENMMDQSHVAYSHSGVAGNRSAHLSPTMTSLPQGQQAQMQDKKLYIFCNTLFGICACLPALWLSLTWLCCAAAVVH